MRPVTLITPSLLAMLATRWSGPELRAAIALLIEELDARAEGEPDDGVAMRRVMRDATPRG